MKFTQKDIIAAKTDVYVYVITQELKITKARWGHAYLFFPTPTVFPRRKLLLVGSVNFH